MNRTCQLIVACALLGALPSTTNAAIELISDFHDGTLQGWAKGPGFVGYLYAEAAGGNPDGFMVAADTASGYSLFAKYAPRTFDLTQYTGMMWDEFVYDIYGRPTAGTGAFLLASDGTVFRTSPNLEVSGEWNTKTVSFDPAIWYQPSLSTRLSTFEEVLQDATIGISMDTSFGISGNPESGVDNVRLIRADPVPEPGSLAVWGFGLVLFLALQRRRRKA